MMNKRCKSAFFLILLVLSAKGISGEADIAISLDHQPLDDLEYGQVIPFSITITNHGPDVAGADSNIVKPVIADIIINISIPLIMAQDFSMPQTCDFLLSFGEPMPGNTLDFIYSFYYPPIAVGESTTCFGLAQVVFQSGSRSAEWFISSPPDTDPDGSNNTATMVFGIRPPMVPAFSVVSITLLILLTLVLTGGYLRTKERLKHQT